MVEVKTASQVSKLSIQLAAAFAVVGIGLMYLYIAATDASWPTKILWASALSLGVAFAFLVIWTIARDVIRERERETQRKQGL